jgi:hypothetical protein
MHEMLECFHHLFDEACFGPKQRYICDLFDFQKNLDEKPEKLAQFLFRCVRIGLPMVGPESKYYGEQCMVKMHLLSMLPAFQEVDPCEVLLELNLHSNKNRKLAVDLMKDCISKAPKSANLPFLFPWYIAKLRLLPKTGIYRCE